MAHQFQNRRARTGRAAAKGANVSSLSANACLTWLAACGSAVAGRAGTKLVTQVTLAAARVKTTLAQCAIVSIRCDAVNERQPGIAPIPSLGSNDTIQVQRVIACALGDPDCLKYKRWPGQRAVVGRIIECNRTWLIVWRITDGTLGKR